MEEGGSFDLNKDLEDLITSSSQKIQNRRIAAFCIYSLEFIAIIAVIFILVLVFYSK